MDDRSSGNLPRSEAATQLAASVPASSAERTSSPPSETRSAGGLAAGDRGTAEKPIADKSRLRKMWKWLTGTPSRKALSALSAVLLAAISGVVGTVAGGVLGEGSNGTVDATQVIVYTPWTPDGHLSAGIHVSASVTGSCTSSSTVAVRPDAYRCFAGRFIYDPCFAAFQGLPNPARIVVCPFPDPNKVTVVHLARSLGSGNPDGSQETAVSDSPTNIVWLIVLANGTRCYRVSGANGSSSGMLDNYDCTGGDSLYNDPQRTSPVWKIFEQRIGTSDMRLASIARAYS
jgi:hypothetical protein